VNLSKRPVYFLYLFFALLIISPAQAAFPSMWGDEPMPSLAPMLDEAMPTVVNIATEGLVVQKSPLFDDPFFKRFFNIPEQQREQKTQGLGSGVIVDAKKGYIVTNNHVIENAEVIHVTLHDGRKVTAELVGADPDTDIAVIKVEADNLEALPFADSSKLNVGDFVVAIGNPYGLRQTVTSGIVSGLGRSGLGIESYEDFIQTDASINPGNSGGALVNLRGELIGINTAIIGPSGGNIGIGFAIPSNMARSVMTQLIEHGKVKRGRLGVVAQDLTPELAAAFNIDQNSGAVIAQVDEGTPAEKVGLKAGDVVTAVNDRKIRNSSDMRNVIGMLPVGSRVELDIRRNGKTREVVAEIKEPVLSVIKGEELSAYLAGLEFSDHESGGIVISKADPRGPGGRNGLKQGDIVLSVNRVEVRRVSDLESAVKKNSRGVLLNIQRGNTAYFLVLK